MTSQSVLASLFDGQGEGRGSDWRCHPPEDKARRPRDPAIVARSIAAHHAPRQMASFGAGQFECVRVFIGNRKRLAEAISHL